MLITSSQQKKIFLHEKPFVTHSKKNLSSMSTSAFLHEQRELSILTSFYRDLYLMLPSMLFFLLNLLMQFPTLYKLTNLENCALHSNLAWLWLQKIILGAVHEYAKRRHMQFSCNVALIAVVHENIFHANIGGRDNYIWSYMPVWDSIYPQLCYATFYN